MKSTVWIEFDFFLYIYYPVYIPGAVATIQSSVNLGIFDPAYVDRDQRVDNESSK